MTTGKPFEEWIKIVNPNVKDYPLLEEPKETSRVVAGEETEDWLPF